MRIAQIAPLTEAVPPKLYGGTERVIHWLTEELVALGHDVTLFASGDSCTSATLVPVWPRALRLDGEVRDPCALHMMMLEQVRRRAAEFDFLHFHLDYYPFSLFCRHSSQRLLRRSFERRGDPGISSGRQHRSRDPISYWEASYASIVDAAILPRSDTVYPLARAQSRIDCRSARLVEIARVPRRRALPLGWRTYLFAWMVARYFYSQLRRIP